MWKPYISSGLEECATKIIEIFYPRELNPAVSQKSVSKHCTVVPDALTTLSSRSTSVVWMQACKTLSQIVSSRRKHVQRKIY